MTKMADNEIQSALQLAKELALRVGRRIREVVESGDRLNVSHKGISDIVTEIDIWSEEQIIIAVRDQFPHHLVIGEETSTALSQRTGKSLPQLIAENVCWIVDPLDGTTNFSNKIPHSAVSIGIAAFGKRLTGLVYDPFRDEMFEATTGKGAQKNGKAISVSNKTELVKSVAALGFPNDRWEHWEDYQATTIALVMSCRNVRVCGAAAIEIAWVGCGRFEAFFEYGIKPWDIAAASLVVEEAGGSARSFGNSGGEEFSLFAESFLFCAPGVLGDLLEVIRTKKAKAPVKA